MKKHVETTGSGFREAVLSALVPVCTPCLKGVQSTQMRAVLVGGAGIVTGLVVGAVVGTYGPTVAGFGVGAVIAGIGLALAAKQLQEPAGGRFGQTPPDSSNNTLVVLVPVFRNGDYQRLFDEQNREQLSMLKAKG